MERAGDHDSSRTAAAMALPRRTVAPMTSHHEDLKARFDQDGFVILEDAVESATLEALQEAIAGHVADHDPEAEQAVFRTDDRDAGREETFFASARGIQAFLEAEALDEAGSVSAPRDRCFNKIGHALHDLDPRFQALARSEVVKDAFAVGGLEHPRLVQSMVIFKPAGIGGEVRWHQDASYLLTEPQRVVGLWIALEDADQTNGCLWMAPGSHRSPLRERYEVDWDSRSGALHDLDSTPWPDAAVPLEVRAGSMVVFHDHIPHRSEANRSARSRVAVTLHAHDAGAAWAPENWLQRGSLADFDL